MAYEQHEPRVSRRGLVVAGAALATASTGVGAAMAQSPSTTSLNPPGRVAPTAFPIASTIASPRQDFHVYRTLGEWDFSPESASANRQFGGKGVHSVGAQTSMWATCDIPGGSKIRDIEWYVSNNTGSTAYAGAWLWSASDGYLGAQLLSTPIASTGSLTATRAVVADANNGPYPTGTKLFLTIFTPTDGKLQINGVRVGLTGGGEIEMLSKPNRVFDSRETSRLSAGEARTVVLPVRQGVVGALAQLSVIKAESAGFAQIYPAPDRPDAGELYYPANGATTFSAAVSVPVNRRIKIYTRRAAHVTLDLVGTIG